MNLVNMERNTLIENRVRFPDIIVEIRLMKIADKIIVHILKIVKEYCVLGEKPQEFMYFIDSLQTQVLI